MTTIAERLQKEVEFGALPALGHERPFSFYDAMFLMIAYSVATWNFILGGWIGYFSTAWDSIAILLIIWFLMIFGSFMCSLNTRYGVEMYVGMKTALGSRGVWGMFVWWAAVNNGWIALCAIMLGLALNAVITAVGGPNIDFRIFALIAYVISVAVAYGGASAFKWMTRFSVPFILAVTFAMIYVFHVHIGWEAGFSVTPAWGTGIRGWDLGASWECGAVWAVGWWIWIGQITRLFKQESATVYGIYSGMGACTFLTAFVSAFTALHLGIFDPVEWMLPIGGLFFGCLALLFIAFANITSCALLTYAQAMSAKSLWPDAKWHTAIATTVPTLGMIMIPFVYDRFIVFSFLNTWAIGPVLGIFFVDYFILRRRRIEVLELYGKHSKYWFWGGFNIPAYIIMVGLGIFGFFIMNPLTFGNVIMLTPTVTMFEKTTATMFITFLAAIIYYAIGKLWLVPRSGKGGYISVAASSGSSGKTS